jgi:hypothetical protein
MDCSGLRDFVVLGCYWHQCMRCNVKTWGWNLEQAMANSTLVTFLQVVRSELIQKYLGDGPSWCENSFVLLMSFPHPLSLSTKLMPLGQRGRFSSCTTLDRTIQFFLHRYTSDSSNLRDVL